MARHENHSGNTLSVAVDPDSMPGLAEKFYEWMQISNYSKATLVNCRTNLNYFFAWCGDRGLIRPNEITKPIVERYQRYLFYYRREKTGRPLSIRSQQVRLTPIRTFFKWLARKNYILYNPASDIAMPRPEFRLPQQVLTAKEAEKVLNQADVSKPSGIRDRAILETFYATGMRRLELINLTIYSVDMERGTVMIRQGKGHRDRLIPITSRAVSWIEKYLFDIRPLYVVGVDEGNLFLTRWGGPFGANTLTQMVRDYIKAAKIRKTGSCHLFRHTLATLMLENGANIRYIQQMLGHTDLESTQVYTRVSIRKLKEVHTNTHPSTFHTASKKSTTSSL